MKFVISSFLVWRTLLFIPLVIGFFCLPYRENQNFTNVLNKVDPGSFVSSFLFFPWANFDGVHYLNIAVNGYLTEGRFFPFYPLLIYSLTFFLGLGKIIYENAFIAGFLISNISFLFSLLFLFKMVKKEYSLPIARLTVIFLLAFPTSFFLGSIYSESLFLLLLLCSFYFIGQKKWSVASFFILLLSLTRFVGIFMLPVIVFEFIRQEKILEDKINIKKHLGNMFSMILIPVGILSFAYFCFTKWGDVLYFLSSHGDLGNNRTTTSVILPFQVVFRYLKIFLNFSIYQYEWWVALLEVLLFFYISMLLIIGFKKGVKKSYLAFSLVAFLIPASSGTFSGLPRYVLILFPVFIALALIKSRAIQYITLAFFILLQSLLLILFSRGYYIA
jgi:Gpi18-like mannosyltransferase